MASPADITNVAWTKSGGTNSSNTYTNPFYNKSWCRTPGCIKFDCARSGCKMINHNHDVSSDSEVLKSDYSNAWELSGKDDEVSESDEEYMEELATVVAAGQHVKKAKTSQYVATCEDEGESMVDVDLLLLRLREEPAALLENQVIESPNTVVCEHEGEIMVDANPQAPEAEAQLSTTTGDRVRTTPWPARTREQSSSAKQHGPHILGRDDGSPELEVRGGQRNPTGRHYGRGKRRYQSYSRAVPDQPLDHDDLPSATSRDQRRLGHRLEQTFSDLERLVMRVAFSPSFYVGLAEICLPSHLPPATKAFYKSWAREPKTVRRHILKAELFQLLYIHILKWPFFRLRNQSGDDDRTLDKEGPDIMTEPNVVKPIITTCPTKMEVDLGKLRTKLANSSATQNSLADWTLSTMRYATLANIVDDTGPTRHISDGILTFLAPLVRQGATDGLRCRLRRDVSQMCEEARKVRRLMSMSKDGYECFVLPPKTQYRTNEHLVEIDHTEAGKEYLSKANMIDFTIFGGLTKIYGTVEGYHKIVKKAKVSLKQEPLAPLCV